ncbi:MAG: DUF58 domain-containing protein [Acidimicrobiia bacterium]
MLTRQGWFAVVTAAVSVVAGRVLGIIELYVLGAGLALLVVLCLLWVRRVKIDMYITRDVHPLTIHAGNSARIDLGVRNDASRRTPVLRLRDPVAGTRGATLNLAPLPPEAVATAAYRLPTTKRGIIEIGPLSVEVNDPLGLASARTEAAQRVELTVYPKVEPLSPVPNSGGRDPHAGTDHPNALGRRGEDFYAIRSYVVGDDIRRIHWPTTARFDDLMVRQEEMPWQGRVTVLLDVRRTAHTDDSLEEAISAAASLVVASWKHGDIVRLVATDGTDTGVTPGHEHAQAVLEHLATVQAASRGSLTSCAEAIERSPHGGGALVIVLGRVFADETDQLDRLRRIYSSVTVAAFLADDTAVVPPSVRLFTANTAADFATTWTAARWQRGGVLSAAFRGGSR